MTEDVQRICNATDLPLLVDIDTGWGGAFNISRTIKSIEKAGAAGVHIEDQVSKNAVATVPINQSYPKSEMIDRIKAAVDGKKTANSW